MDRKAGAKKDFSGKRVYSAHPIIRMLEVKDT